MVIITFFALVWAVPNHAHPLRSRSTEKLPFYYIAEKVRTPKQSLPLFVVEDDSDIASSSLSILQNDKITN